MLTPLAVAVVSLVVEPLTVRVVAPDGTPAAGAQVWAVTYPAPDRVAGMTEPQAAVADVGGRAVVAGPRGSKHAGVFARDGAGRIGSGEYRGEGGVMVSLAPVAPRVVRVTADGGPVAGAKVVVSSTYAAVVTSDGHERLTGETRRPPWEPAAVTNPAGEAIVLTPPGHGVFYSVAPPGRGPVPFVTTPGSEMRPTVEAAGAVRVRVAGVSAAKAKGARYELYRLQPDALGRPGTRVIFSRSGTLDGGEAQTFAGLPPGAYRLAVVGEGQVDAVFVGADDAEVKSGGTATVTATFAEAATVRGRVVDSAGNGVADVTVPVAVRAEAGSARTDSYLSVTTGADGRFVAHGPPGWYQVQLDRLPPGYALPPRDRHEPPPAVRAAVGEPQDFPPVRLLNAVTFRAKLVLDGGEPAPKAQVKVFFSGQYDRDTAAAGPDGSLVLPDLPPDDSVAPRVRLGSAVNVPETFVLDLTPGEVKIRLSESNAAGFTGRVVGPDGRPVAGAKASAVHSLPAVGRGEGMSRPWTAATAVTGADGRYTLGGLWPTDSYTVRIAAAGFAKAEVRCGAAVAGQTADLGRQTLDRVGLAVAGVVRDADGRPIAGAEVFAVDGPARMTTTSAADGSFKLSGYYDAPGWVFATKPGFRLAAAPVTPGGAGPAAVTLRGNDAPPLPTPALSPEYKKSLDRLTRHVLTRVFETRTGWSGNAMADMARYDLDTARKWRDAEVARPGGRGYPGLVAAEERRRALFDLAQTDIDEAVAQLQALKGDAFAESLALARRLLPVDKAAAARVAEEAAIRARRRDPVGRPSDLAETGELAVLAGNRAGGARLLAEAADLADKLDAAGATRATYSIGSVACRLALVDRPRAEALRARLADPRETERWLTATCRHVAAADPDYAIALLDRYKPSGSHDPDRARLSIAEALAPTDFPRAEKLVAEVAEVGHRFRGHLMLARYADKAQSAAMIDRAFALLESDADGFLSWSNYGGRGGFAAAGAVAAARVGHPDTAGLVHKALAMRPTGDESHRGSDRDRSLAAFASALALTDPPTARRVLYGVAPPGGYADRALSGGRDLLFAQALADPDAAIVLVDGLLERAKKPGPGGADAISATGLVELGSLLTAPDPLARLARYGRLPIGGDEHD